MVGGVNTRQSRRTRPNLCKYWQQDKTIRDLSEYKTLKQVKGTFYAKEENTKYSQNNIVGNSFMFNSSTITISTSDTIEIKTNDVVEFQHQLWRVSSVQSKEIHKQNALMDIADCITYLQLKR